MIEVTEKQNCCGCTACVAVCPKNCIEMKEDIEGFLYPEVNQSNCIHCNACDRVCPILNVKEKKPFEQIAYIVQNKDKEILRESTAGGAFTSIAEYVIRQGGVVCGVSIDENYRVKHIFAESKDELGRFRNSKYVQSDINGAYQKVKEYLAKGRLVCFSGTPCQVEGLLHYLNKEYENLITVDVVCRAVPSPGVWKKYIEYEKQKNGKIRSVRFRDKSLGYQYSTMEIKMEDGRVARGGIESQTWLRMFFSGMIIRPSCTRCEFRNQYRNSDFTIWDCFNSYKIDKSFNEDVGTTRILLHTDKAVSVFNKISSTFVAKRITIEEAVSGVKEMVESPASCSNRNTFFEDFNTMGMGDLITKYYPETVKVQIKKNARRLLNYFGMDKAIKHILKR